MQPVSRSTRFSLGNWHLDEHPFDAVQGRADPAARVFVLGAVEVGRALICLDRNRHFDPASIIKDQGPHACNEALLHEIDERRLRSVLKTVWDRVAHVGPAYPNVENLLPWPN
jgi:hypothetical protein